MKKLFIYVGSRSGDKSTTLKFINGVVNKTVESLGNENIDIDIYIPPYCKINNCLGCACCFYNGMCPQDKNDDMEIVKLKLLEADFIIFASPVYLHNVSGDMKVFIDRISYWTHLLKLAGKVGIAISTSTGNGLEITSNYIHKVMAYLGIKVVGELGVMAFLEDERYFKALDKCSDTIIEYFNGKKIETDKALELVFEANKIAIEQQYDLETTEYRYWKDSGLIQCNNFKEVLEMLEEKTRISSLV